MAKFASKDLRNIGVIGHDDAGKTTLVSACLYTTGAVSRLGRVEDGHTTTDFDEEEIDRQISIQVGLAHAPWRGSQVTFVDTPGYAVFRAETKGAIRVVDGALVTVDALSGAQVMTEKVWEYMRDLRVPGVIVVNRLDRENSSFERAVESCVDSFGREVVALQLPIGAADQFTGIVDLLEMNAYTYAVDGNGKGTACDIPDDMKETAEAAHEALVEMVAESNEELLEIYFEEGGLTGDQLATGVRDAVLEMRLFPVLCMSAAHNIGTDRILDACLNMLPSPTDRRQLLAREDGDDVWIDAAAEAPFAGLVFKTVSDAFAGRINYMKTFTGCAKADATVVNVRTGSNERLSNMSSVQGKQLEPLDEAVPGQIFAVTKLKDTGTSDTLRAKASEAVVEHVAFPKAAISFALEPESKGDEEKISNAIARLKDEDPTLGVERDPQTHELLLSGIGQLHVEVTLAKMKRRYGVNARLHPPKVPYRETIRGTAEAEGRHKKQSGGRGQFGVAKITVAPLPAGSGFEFEDKIFGGSISQSYRPAVEKGVIEASARGVLAGYPMVDFKVQLTDGKEHAVDSSEMAFKIAGSMAFKDALPRARPVLLEPIMKLEINVPDDAMGDVMGDLNSRRGRVQGMDPRKNRQIIHAEAPLAEILSYAVELNSLTGGRGTYTMEFSRYDDVPPNVAQKVIEASKRAADAAG
jgi:elongation factor G